MKSKGNNYLALILLILAMFLLYSCSPAPIDMPVIEKISVSNGVITLRASRICDYCENTDEYLYFISNDSGLTWEEIATPTIDALQALNLDIDNPSLICSSVNGLLCYRITDQEQIDISNDGGNTWQVDWQIPVGRKFYMEKRSPYPRPDTVPLDIRVMEFNSGQVVIVAMGNQGVLVKSLEGIWNRHAVGKAIPTPYYAADFSEANIVLYYDRINIMLVAACLFLLLSISVWISAYINSNAVLRKKILRACLPFVFSVIVFFLYYLVASISNQNIYNTVRAFLPLILPLPFIGFLVTWVWIIVVSTRKWFCFFALVAGVGFSILSYFILLFPLQLWALGDIAVYENAETINWVLGLSILLIGLVVENRITFKAVKPIEQQSFRRGDL